MKITISEDLEIFTAICLLSKDDKILSFFNEVVFFYIPGLEKNLSFLKESKIQYLLKTFKGKILLQLLENDEVIKEIEEIKQDERWREWWKCWKTNLTQIINFYNDLINKVLHTFNFELNFEIVIPLFLNKTLYKKTKINNLLISNFGFAFEENIIMNQKGDSLFEDNISKQIFNISTTFYELNDCLEFSEDWKLIQKLDYKTLLKIDETLKKHNSDYNFIKNNIYLRSLKECKFPVESSLTEFEADLKNSDILLVGEQHFIFEQEDFLIKNFEKLYSLGFHTICLEVPKKFQSELNDFLNGIKDDLNENICMMRDFLFALKKNKNLELIKIYCVDSDTDLMKTQEDFLKREIEIFRNIKDIKNDNKIIGIFGNYHVQKNKKFYLFRDDNSKALAELLSQEFSCISINIFGLSGEEKIGPVNCKIRHKFNNLQNFRLGNFNEESFFKYKNEENQLILLDSNTYTVLKKTEISPFDYSLIFPKQKVSEWSCIYER